MAAALFLAVFGAYVLTLFPGLAGGDSGELAVSALVMGVPHPTGYPLFMVLARLWLWVFPLGEVAFRLNVLTALLSASSSAVLYALHRRLGLRPAAAAAAALLFAWSPAVWSQSLAFEVYSLQLLLGALYLLCLLRWEQGEERYLYFAALLAGAQLAHHLTSLFTVLSGAVLVLARGRRLSWGRDLWRLLLLALLPLVLYLYLPARSRTNPPVDWGNPETLGAMADHVTGRQYGSKIFPVSAPDIEANLRFLGSLLAENLPLLLWAAGAAGLFLLLRRSRPFGAAMIALASGQGIFCVLYRVQDLGAFTLPLLLALNLGLGQALALLDRSLAEGAGRRFRPLAAGLILAAVIARGGFEAPGQDHHDNYAAPAYGDDILDSLPFEAQLIAEGDIIRNALLYGQVAGQRRTDVSVLAQEGEVFQGYGSPSPGAPRIFVKDLPSQSFLPGRERAPFGLLFALQRPDVASGPDPWAAYRSLEELGLPRWHERNDAGTHIIAGYRAAAGRFRAISRGDREGALRYTGESMRHAERVMEVIVPREQELTYMTTLASSLELWEKTVLWGERLAAVAGLSPPLGNNLAWAYYMLDRRPDRAESLARQAVAAEPEQPFYLDTLAVILHRRGKTEEARRVMERALRLAPDHPGIRADAEKILGGIPE